MKRFFRFSAITLAFVIGLLALWLGVTFLWLKGSLPQLAGEVRVQGLEEQVRIIRDRDGVPVPAGLQHLPAGQRQPLDGV